MSPVAKDPNFTPSDGGRYTFKSASGHEVILTVHPKTFVAITGDCYFTGLNSDLCLEMVGTHEAWEFNINLGPNAAIGIPESVYDSPELAFIRSVDSRRMPFSDLADADIEKINIPF